MLVFGDRGADHDPRELLAALGERIGDVRDHDGLVGLFVDASELAQGLADAEASARGADGRGPIGDAAMRLLVALGAALDASWAGVASPSRSGPRAAVVAPGVLGPLEQIVLPERIRTNRAEGYAYYAVYPEAYLAAARRGLGTPPVHVIGLRSIGMGLAALIAAARRTRLPLSVRPVGEPWRRTLRLAPSAVAEWQRERDASFAIADEGPGLSGSSFGAVLDALEGQGVPLERIDCFPSHAGELGPIASEHHRERWRRCRRHVVTVDELLLDSGRLTRALEPLLGPLERPLEDVSAGAWRRRHYHDEAQWPPVITSQERRKLLAHTRHRATWLVRFVGLGRLGEEALARARALHRAGFTPEVAGLVHGFLVERWHDDARPLDAAGAVDRAMLIERVGHYLGARACRPAVAGADLDELIAVVRRNAPDGESLVRMLGPVRELSVRRHPVEIDGRLHAWEWLVRRDGAVLKADAYDHHDAHDLVGCQDITWDLAGAAIELGLTTREEDRLAAIVGAISGRAPDPALRRLSRPCYLAFQLGRVELAREAAEPTEAHRLHEAARRYAALLRG